MLQVVSKVLIERAAENKLKVIVLTASRAWSSEDPATGIDDLKADLEKLTGKDDHHRHRRSKKNRTGRTAHSGKHRTGSRKKSFLQKSYEAGDRQNDEGRRKGYQGSVHPEDLAALKSQEAKSTAKVTFLSTR